MKKKISSKVSLGDIAKAAGISRPAVCYALQNRPGVSKATRERVQRIANKLGYVPDARIAFWMRSLREVKSKELLPIAWLNTTRDKDAWHKHKFHTPYMEGARERALELGYRIDEIWTHQPSMTMRRLSQILDQRGIEGVIITLPATHIRLNWDRLVCVDMGGTMLAPRLHRVMGDTNYNLLLVLKLLHRHGYRRIGICLPEHVGRHVLFPLRSTPYYVLARDPKSNQIPPLFYRTGGLTYEPDVERQFVAWAKRHRPDVIVVHDNRAVEWLEAAGFRVPEEVGVVHLAIDDDVLGWTGIYSNRREIGATAAEWVISLMQNHRFGVPKINLTTHVRGSWHPGGTLLIPRKR